MAAEPQTPQAPVIIGEETLTGLPMFRNLIEQMFAEWNNDHEKSVVAFLDCVREIFREPLVNFDKAYDLFNSYCQNKEQANLTGDHWRVFQMMVYTELAEDREKILGEFVSMVRRIMNDSPGGKELYLRKLVSGNVQPTDGPKSIAVGMDYVILLAIRVYIGGVRIVGAPKEEET